MFTLDLDSVQKKFPVNEFRKIQCIFSAEHRKYFLYSLPKKMNKMKIRWKILKNV